MIRCRRLVALISLAGLLFLAEARDRRQVRSPEGAAACSSRCAAQVHTIRLLPDQELKSEIEKYAVENCLEAAYVATCVGSLKNVTLSYATNPVTGVQKVETLAEYLEVCALSGTVGSAAGAHLHVVLGRPDGSTVAGHVVGNARIQFTAEVVIGASPCERYDRQLDPLVGSNQLVVTRK